MKTAKGTIAADSLDPEFMVDAETSQLQLTLRYSRAPGQMRLRGQVQVNGLELESLP